jgi:hypothetical protein
MKNNKVNRLAVPAHAGLRRMVKDIVEARMEHKVGALAVAETVVTTAGTVNVITQQITQGDDINNRTGDMIAIDDLKLVINVRNTTAGFGNFAVRFILFADTLNTGTIPTVGEVLNSAAITSGYLPINRQKNRFKVYMDTIVDSVGQTNSMSVSKDLTFKINRKCFYSGAASVAASNGKGALFLLEIANAAAATHLFSWGWELKFMDA